MMSIAKLTDAVLATGKAIVDTLQRIENLLKSIERNTRNQ